MFFTFLNISITYFPLDGCVGIIIVVLCFFALDGDLWAGKDGLHQADL